MAEPTSIGLSGYIDKYEIVYENLLPHQKKFYDTVESILKLGVTPTPKVVNEALGKHKRTSWNGPLCNIRRYLLFKYGYKMIHVGRSGHIRYRKVVN